MESFSLILAIVVVTALAFDFTNGFHDTANAMATTISTGALKPKVAVAMSAVLNLVGAFLSVEVANTISKGLVDEVASVPRSSSPPWSARSSGISSPGWSACRPARRTPSWAV